MNGSWPGRSHPAHYSPIERPNRSTIVLVTVCTARRAPILATSEASQLITQAWRNSMFWRVGRYVIMPDHLHVFCSPAEKDAPPLTAWVRFWKTYVSNRWHGSNRGDLWQQGFWDRQLRDVDHYAARWTYVRNNPVRRGLVAHADAWPWQGELNAFRFHD